MGRSWSRAAVAAVVAMLAPATAPAAGAATAPAQVFAPNPVADPGIQTLTDQKDADYFSADPALRRAYHRVSLTDLISPSALSGAYVTVRSETGAAASNTGAGFIFTRDQDQFEQVMAYYWITRAQRYIQGLGFGSVLPAVNRRQVPVRINQFGGDNSFFRDTKTDITLGKGGVDDAEDAEVILHEYGHSQLADTIIIRAQFDFAPDTTMPTAAAQTIATAALYGRTAQRTVTAAFAARGLT